jgi:hypothetical protein
MVGDLSEVEINGIQPGLTTLHVALFDGATVIASQTHNICIPQFVTIDEGGNSSPTAFDDVLNVFQLGSRKDDILQVAKQVVNDLLSTSNVRTIWRVGPFGDTVPAHIPTGNITTLLIQGEPPAAHPGRLGATNPPAGVAAPGPTVFNETIDIFPGAMDNPAGELSIDAVALLIDIEAQGMTPVLEPFAVNVVGRLLGLSIAHEIIHSLLGFDIPTGHNSPAIPGDIMNQGRDLTFLDATGFNNTARVNPVDPADFIDNGIASIARLTAVNQTRMNARFPTQPRYQ